MSLSIPLENGFQLEASPSPSESGASRLFDGEDHVRHIGQGSPKKNEPEGHPLARRMGSFLLQRRLEHVGMRGMSLLAKRRRFGQGGVSKM